MYSAWAALILCNTTILPGVTLFVYQSVHNKFWIYGPVSAKFEKKFVFKYQNQLESWKFCEYWQVGREKIIWGLPWWKGFGSSSAITISLRYARWPVGISLIQKLHITYYLLSSSRVGDEMAKRGHANDSCVLLKVHLSTVNLIYSCPALNEQFMSFIPWLHHWFIYALFKQASNKTSFIK